MQGLELSRKFYESCGAPMLREQFADVLPYLAAGLLGSGSECLGYDDEVSRDHDFEPGFCIFLPGEEVVDRQTAFRLERAYARLPRTFEGFARSMMSPVGGSRHGVLRTGEFYQDKVGAADGDLTVQQWLTLPQYALGEATNGAVFFDPYGEFSAIRQKLLRMPEDIRRKRLAGQLLLMAQSGQYNYRRCLAHGETGAAQLAAAEFVRAAMETVFLLEKRYAPYYKWSFRALRELPGGASLALTLEMLLTTDNGDKFAGDKYDAMESLASDVIERLRQQNLTRAVCGDLEKHAYSVNDGIADAEIRNLHILAAV